MCENSNGRPQPSISAHDLTPTVAANSQRFLGQRTGREISNNAKPWRYARHAPLRQDGGRRLSDLDGKRHARARRPRRGSDVHHKSQVSAAAPLCLFFPASCSLLQGDQPRVRKLPRQGSSSLHWPEPVHQRRINGPQKCPTNRRLRLRGPVRGVHALHGAGSGRELHSVQ